MADDLLFLDDLEPASKPAQNLTSADISGTWDDLVLAMILYSKDQEEFYTNFFFKMRGLLTWLGLERDLKRTTIFVSEELPVLCLACGRYLGYCEGGTLKLGCRPGETTPWLWNMNYERQEISGLTGFSQAAVESAWVKAISIIQENSSGRPNADGTSGDWPDFQGDL